MSILTLLDFKVLMFSKVKDFGEKRAFLCRVESKRPAPPILSVVMKRDGGGTASAPPQTCATLLIAYCGNQFPLSAVELNEYHFFRKIVYSV